MIGHCDCNNFYVSCFRVFMPELVGRPVGVLSSGDGCIVARSNELKAMGVANGTPVFQLPHEVRAYSRSGCFACACSFKQIPRRHAGSALSVSGL